MNQSAIRTVLMLFISILFVSCQTGAGNKQFVSVDGDKFIDSDGRTVILNGINYVTKDPKQYFLNDNDAEIFRKFRDWGFNTIRFGMSWRGIEPEPGKIDEAYLKEIDKRVKLAEENGLWLILDMHQDLYGGKYGNGAPDWATFDDGLPHDTGDVWSDAYLVSPAIHRVFDNFWNNRTASDGIGIQDHYIFVWKTLAKRYASSSAVIGFDIMNEPFTGSHGEPILMKLLGTYGAIAAEISGKALDSESLMELWGNEESRTLALESFNDKELYAKITESAYEEVKAFEQGPLSRFYQKVRDAIRTVNKRHILFLEHSYFCNLGVKSSFEIPKDKNGNLDPLCAYAPHGYDLVTDTDAADSPGYNRVEHIYDQIVESGREKGVPMLVGEWGAFYMGRNYLEPAQHLTEIIEKNLLGQTYWAYWNNIETQDYFFKTISRTYPMLTNGNLIGYLNNFSQNRFECEWEETGTQDAPTRIYLPDVSHAQEQLSITPKSSLHFQQFEGSKSGYVEIEPIGEKRNLMLPF